MENKVNPIFWLTVKFKTRLFLLKLKQKNVPVNHGDTVIFRSS